MLIDRPNESGSHSWRQTSRMSRRGLGSEAVGSAEIVLPPGAPQQFLRRVNLSLAAPHRRIHPPLRKEVLMRATLGDDAFVEDQDLVGVDDSRKAMGDHDRGASARDAL